MNDWIVTSAIFDVSLSLSFSIVLLCCTFDIRFGKTHAYFIIYFIRTTKRIHTQESRRNKIQLATHNLDPPNKNCVWIAVTLIRTNCNRCPHFCVTSVCVYFFLSLTFFYRHRRRFNFLRFEIAMAFTILFSI